MYRVIAPAVLFMLLLSRAGAQEVPDFHNVNTETYRLYLARQWDSLLVMGKDALKADMDYYYLRMRMGIALYNKKKYRQAIAHFERALRLNQGDQAALELLYYCRLLSGQGEAAKLVRKQFRGELALRMPPPGGKFFSSIGVEYLYHSGIKEEEYTSPSVNVPALPPGVQYATVRYSNAFLALENSIIPGFSLQHAYTFLAKTNHLYYYDGTNQFQMDEQQVTQHQYYLAPRISWKSGLSIQPMVHLVGGHYQYPVQFIPGYMGGFGQVIVGEPDYFDLATGLGLSLDIGVFSLKMEGQYSNLNQARQVQGRVGAVLYPKGNLGLYAGAFLAAQVQRRGGDDVTSLVPEALLGFSIGEKVWFDLDASFGDMSNYLEYNGMIIYNSFTEVIEKKVKASLSFQVSEKGSLLYLGGRWSSNRSEFSPLGTATEITNALSYNALSIYGGISWKF